MNLFLKLYQALDPASEGDAYQLMPIEKKRKQESIFTFRLRRKLAYRRY